MTNPQESSCCDMPKKTVSVSTTKGRRTICNNCGAPWKFPETSSKEESSLEQKIWIFIAYQDDVPVYSKLFDDHGALKMFSAMHSSMHKKAGYNSTYLFLQDTSFLRDLLALHDSQLRERIGKLRRENVKSEKWSDDYFYALQDVLSLLPEEKV